MDVETSLSWRGAYWYAGRRPIRSDNADLPEDLDVSLIDVFNRQRKPPTALPAAVVVDVTQIPEDIRESFFAWLATQLKSLPCEVPYYVLTCGNDDLPEDLRATGIIGRSVPDDVLLMLICIQQRAILRTEEARIRRQIFGRIPGFGTAPHQSGTSGLLVVGLSGRFLEWQAASEQKVEVIGAFDGAMAAEFMTQRAFDAVVIDTEYEDTIDYMQQVRRDPRFAGLPVLAVCENQEDSVLLFRNGASDVLMGTHKKETLNKRLAAAIRFGKHRRLADRVLAESHSWLRQQINVGGLGTEFYSAYLETSSNALATRGLDLWEMRLTPEYFNFPEEAHHQSEDFNGTLLSIADATSRDEDLVCLVRDLGPVAVLKNEAGPRKLQKRINSILSHTVI
ncbi:MAG: hypothetical protein ABJN98_03135 [Roseibium sp.]